MSDPITVRPFAGEYTEFVEIMNACWPEYPASAAEIADFDARRSAKARHRRVLARRCERIVGYAEWHHELSNFHPDEYYFDLSVHPAWRENGAGGALYSAILADLKDLPVQEIRTATREHHTVARGALERRGYSIALREPVSVLDVEKADMGRFADLVRRVEGQFRLCTRAQFQAEDPEGYVARLHALLMTVKRDMPSASPPTPIPLDLFAKRMLIPGLPPEGTFLALDGDRLVGLSELYVSEADPGQLMVCNTGVLRDYRRRGIATALKVKTVDFAKARSARTIATDNEEKNPMYQINLALGFEPEPAWLTYRWRPRD